MLDTLRRRLVLSHLLPLLLVVPLMGIALVYVLGTQVLLPSISQDLLEQGRLVANIAEAQPSIWQDHSQAQALVDRLSPELTAHVMLIDARGHIIAATNHHGLPPVAQTADLPGLPAALAGRARLRTSFEPSDDAQLADALIPVLGPGNNVVGVVRVTHEVMGLAERFARLRYLIAGILAASLVLGAAAGWALALDIAGPLQDVTNAVHQLARREGQPGQLSLAGAWTTSESLSMLPEQGPAEIRQLFRSINTLVYRLQSVETSRRQLLANLVHELGRPLGALQSAIQALEGGASEDAELRQELLAGMGAEVMRLRRLLDDLARLHHQATGPVEIVRQPIGFSAWLPELLVTWREAALASGLRWSADIPSNLPVIWVDSDRLAQALTNLISNAIRYTPSGGSVSVIAGCTDADGLRRATNGSEGHSTTELWIQVSDTGPGIPAEERELVFQPLYRGSPARGFAQGMGLGLAIAQEMANAHHGRVEVASVPGQGSTFTLWLPVDGP